MKRSLTHLSNLSLLTAALLAACNDDTSGSGLFAGKGRFAVVSSNYSGASSISLLGADGEVTAADWVSSKTENPDLRTPLTQDVVLPSNASDSRYVTTLERSLGVITRFDVVDGSVVGQLRTDDSPQEDEAAFHSNPQDVLYVSAHSAWVSRWRQNPDESAEPRERGNDLIELDPGSFERTARRIDFRSLNEEIEEEQFDKDGKSRGKLKVIAYASPNAIVPVAGFAAVGITGITDSYSYAMGKLAIVDIKQAKLLHTLELGDLANCGEVKPVPGDDNSVVVACIGAYGDEGARAGIVKVSVDGSGKPKQTQSFRVTEHQDAANSNSYVASLGGDIVIAVASGHIDPKTMQADEPDRLFKLDLSSGEQTELRASEGAFAIGVPAYDAVSGILLVPDAGGMDAPRFGVHRFKVDAKHAPKYDAFVEVAPETSLTARQVLAL
jgi:hypothetical protein